MPPIPTLAEAILIVVMVGVVALPEVARSWFKKPTPPAPPTQREES